MIAACIIGCDWQREDIISALRSAGALVVGVDRDDETSNNVDRLIPVSVAPNDLGFAADAVFREMQRLSGHRAGFPVIVDTELGLPLAMALAPRNFQIFRDMRLLDKARQYEFLAAAGIDVPRWLIAADWPNAPAASLFGGDVVVKPRLGWAASGVRFPSHDEIASADAIVQEAIYGDVVLLALELAQRRLPKILGALRHGRTPGAIRSGHSAVSVQPSEKLCALAMDVCQALTGFQGVLQVEAIVDDLGVPHLLEVTPMLPNLLVRKLLGIKLERVRSDGILQFCVAREPQGSRVAAWLYPETHEARGNRFEAIRATNQVMSGVTLLHPPRATRLRKTGDALGAVGIVLASATNPEEAARRLWEAAASMTLELDCGSVLGVMTLGLQDIL